VNEYTLERHDVPIFGGAIAVMPTRPSGVPTAQAAAEPVGEGALFAVQKWRVAEEFSGQRIDNYLISRLKGVPKTRIYRMLRSGEVRVNGGRVASDYRVQPDDLLRIPPVRVAEGTASGGLGQAKGQVSPAAAKSISDQIQVVFEDDAVLAINKPVGVAVHGGSGVKLGVIEALRQTSQPVFLELVHRLDRETSGLMLLAKKRPALTEFHRQLREGQMRKRYLAVVWGSWPAALDQIDAPLHKWVNAKGERWVRVDPQGQVAITRVKCLQRVEDPVLGAISLLQCEPITGRTHQLRVHLAAQGHPILGDPKYGDHVQDELLKPLGFRRMFLHAWQLRCIHPKTKEKLFLKADIDAACQSFLLKLNLETP
jgi:23S rRNA pseudouridine955/2504/2580 synthase